jgi:hypothetical protein
MCFALFLITIEDIGLQFRDSLTLRVLSGVAKGVIYLSCSLMHLCFGIGIPYKPSGMSNFFLDMVTPCASLILIFFIMAGSDSVKAKPESGWEPIQPIAKYPLLVGIYLAYMLPFIPVLSFFSAQHQFSVNFAWLYLVIPPSLYVMICLIYWGFPKIRAFMPTFRRNR